MPAAERRGRRSRVDLPPGKRSPTRSPARGSPTLILLDELSVYLRKVKSLPGARDQLSAFLTSLFKAVEGTANAALVYTLAIGKQSRSTDAYSDENEYIAERMAEAESISARKATLLNPTEDDETAQVLRRRLFATIDGRQVEALGTDGRWQTVSRDEVKRVFREGKADILLCTDAAAEGLNFQFCGALVNYDMPWNPMRVEQRIGRIDRVGQRHAHVRIINLHYADTVEADVYVALRNRIGLFESVVGRLQPILAELPRTIAATVLRGTADQDARAQATSDVERRIDALQADRTALDLDLLADDVLEMAVRDAPALDLDALDHVIRRRDAMPVAAAVRPLGVRQYGYLTPGMREEVRVTTDPACSTSTATAWSSGRPARPSFQSRPSWLATRTSLSMRAKSRRYSGRRRRSSSLGRATPRQIADPRNGTLNQQGCTAAHLFSLDSLRQFPTSEVSCDLTPAGKRPRLSPLPS